MNGAVAKPYVYLRNFEHIRPRFEGSQEHGINWISAAHARAEKTKALHQGEEFDEGRFASTMRRMVERFGCGADKIAKRGHELEDFTHVDWERSQVFSLGRDARGVGAQQRTAFYKARVEEVMGRFYADAREPPAALVHVTCTGYVSPSAAQALVAKKGWNSETVVTHAYHMGCYASIPAVRIAAGFLASREFLFPKKRNRVDVVHNELCTLHFNPLLHSPEQLVVQSLFADGHIRYSLELAQGECAPGLKLLSLREEIVPHSDHAMSWSAADWGMQMTLSKDVPLLVASRLKEFVVELMSEADLNSAEVWKNCYFAVHPGGPKIIDKVAELLELSDNAVRSSREVLMEFGNMSSATLPHVWQRLLQEGEVKVGEYIVSLAFGPGLTICGAVFQKT